MAASSWGRWRRPARARTVLVALLTALALGAAACARDVDTEASDAAPDGCDPGVHAALTAWEDSGFSGTVAFIDPDQPCVAGFGAIDPTGDTPMPSDAVFSIGSITKAVTAATVAGLAHDGLLSYDDRAGDLVPGLTGPVADATVGQLLLHTSGITGSHGRDSQPLSRAEAIDALSGLERVSDPGQEFGYANAGYVTLALIVDELAGGYRDQLRSDILVGDGGAVVGGFWNGEPAAGQPRAIGVLDNGEPGADGSFAGPHWALDGAGGVAMTAEELAAWTTDLFQGRIVAPEAVDGLLAQRFDHGDGTVEVPGWALLDEVPYGEPLFGTAGGGGDVGHQMVAAWLPESERAFVIAANTPEVSAEQLLAALLPDLVAGRTPAGPAVASELDPDLVEAVSGTWELDDGARFDIRPEGPGVRVRALDPGAVSTVLPLGDPDAAADHQRRVLEVIGGSTAEGRRERELFEENVGPIAQVTPFGTAFIEGEHRTWLTVELADGESVLMWLALEGPDAIAAAEVGTEPPSVGFLVGADGLLRPLGPSGEVAEPGLALEGVELRITNGDQGSVATRPG